MALGLKPEVSVGVSLATAAVVFATYQHALPSVADTRVAQPNDTNIDSARKMASWTSAGLVAGISLIAKDPTVFVVGGAMIVVLDWWYRHANTVDPTIAQAVGTVSAPASPQVGDTYDTSQGY
jgi:hypothetical protein